MSPAYQFFATTDAFISCTMCGI